MPPRTSRRTQNSTRGSRDSDRGPSGTRRVQRGGRDDGGRSTRRMDRDGGGRGSRRGGRESGRRGKAGQPIAGYISLGIFAIFLICYFTVRSMTREILISMSQGGSGPDMSSIQTIAMLVDVIKFTPYVGIVAAGIGLFMKEANKIPAIVGISLNALAALWVISQTMG